MKSSDSSLENTLTVEDPTVMAAATFTSTTMVTTTSEATNVSMSLDCGESYFNEFKDFRFWCDGVSVSIIGVIGLIGNVMALIVLSRPKLRDAFHQLLLALACFDILYIVCGGINYTFRAFEANSDIYTYLFPYLLYPLTHVAMSGTIFMTLAISIERYLGLCHPLLPPQARKSWFYIIPVIIVSFALNAPKFLEVELTYIPSNETGTDLPAYRSSALRVDDNYIRYYIMVTRVFTTGVIPIFLLLFLNIRIIFDLFSSKVNRFGSKRRQRKEINLCLVLLCIVFIFFCCHATRITLDVIEFAHIEEVIECPKQAQTLWHPGYFAQLLFFISHILIILNSSVNFFVYCLVGHTFRRELCRVLGLRKYIAIPLLAETTSTQLTRMNSSYATNMSHFSSHQKQNGHNSGNNKNSTYNMVATLNENDKILTSPIIEGKRNIIRFCDNSNSSSTKNP